MSSPHIRIAGAMHAFNPFPGLRPFEPDEDYIFFGREKQTDDLMRKLRTTRFLSILGNSGSGKSSLVRSGLIPSLYGGGMTLAGSRWRVAIMRPGEDPLGNLAAALSEPGVLGPEGFPEEVADTHLTRAFFETTLRASQRGLIECIRHARIGTGSNVLVLVDQFEELFRYKRSRRNAGRDEAAAFVKLLLEARDSEESCYIVITMRSDFIGDCMEFGRLPEVINEGIYLVPRMTRDELKLAITGPVAVGRATIAPRLVSRLLNDVGDDPDQLPILQHALMRMWERWETDMKPREPLDLAHYEAIGTMKAALSRHAEEAFNELDPRQQEVAGKVFKTLADKGADSRGVRRPAALSEICARTGAGSEQVTRVLEVFRKPGRSFLMPPLGVPLRPDSIIDLSHESLMRIWERLCVWAEEEARSGQLYLNVARAAQRHEEGVAALWRDPELQIALTWRAKERPTAEWAMRYDPSFARAMAFLDDSMAERDREIRDREERRRRELSHARVLVMILAIASALTLALGAYAFSQQIKAKQEAATAESAQQRADAARLRAEMDRRKAREAQERAEAERTRAEAEKRRADDRSLAAVESTAKAESERQRADLQRVFAETKEREARVQKAAAETARSDAETEKTMAIRERAKAQTSEKEALRLSHLAAAHALALTISNDRPADSPLLALAAWRLNNENGGRPQDPDVFTAMRTALDSVAKTAVRRGFPDSIRAMTILHEPQAAAQRAYLGGDDGSIMSVALDAEGRDKGEPVLVGKLPSPIRSLAVRRRGDLLAAGTAGGTVALWDLRNPKAPPRQLTVGAAPVSSVSFSPSGPALVAGTVDGTLQMWDVENATSAPTPLLSAGEHRVTAVTFSPDGRQLAVGTSDAAAIVIDVARPGAKPRQLCGSEEIRSLAFRPDGNVLACGTRTGQILQQIVRPGSGNETGRLTSLVGHGGSVNALSFDRAGAFLASASSDGTVRIWDAAMTGTQAIVLPGHQSWVWSVAFSPDGERLISAGQDRTMRIWPARTEVLAADLCRAGNRTGDLAPAVWSRYMPANVPYRGSPCDTR